MFKKYQIILLAVLFMFTGCYEPVERLNGSNSDNSSNSNNSNSGDNQTETKSDIVNPAMRVAADENDALKQTFFSPAIATNVADIKYTWNFDDGTTETTDNNVVTHRYDKYGKTYKVELKLENSKSGVVKYAYLDLTIDKPAVFINCDTSGLKIFCKPIISETSINDAEYTWNIYSQEDDSVLMDSINSTGSASIDYTFPASGRYKVVLDAESEKVEGSITADNFVNISNLISQGDITYNVISEDKLTYEYSFSAAAKTGTLEFCWDFDGKSSCSNDSEFAENNEKSIDKKNYTYTSYEPVRVVTAYARLKNNPSEIVSKTIIFEQELPKVTINASGSGYDKIYTADFSFKPSGNLTYIWNTGDNNEYSGEQVYHTYNDDGLYQVTLNVLNDKFASTIESVQAEPLLVNVSSSINNLFIEQALISQEQSGETYSFSSPAQATEGNLYFIWKINNDIVSEGENISSIQYKFPKYGVDNSVSLEVRHMNTGKVSAADPLLIKTTVPNVVLYPPQSVLKNIPENFIGEITDKNTSRDFSSILLNPVYELEIKVNDSKEILSALSRQVSLSHTFTETGTKVVKLKVTADNLAEPLYSEPVTVSVNDVVIKCDFVSDETDKFIVNAECAPSDTNASYQYRLSYRQEVDGEIITTEHNSSAPAQITFYLHKPNKLYNYDSRDILINYEISKDADFKNIISGYINYTFKANERPMGLVQDILDSYQRVNSYELPTYEDKKGVTYALSENQYVYSWGKGGYAGHGITGENVYILTPRRITSINEPIKEMKKIDDKIIYTALNSSNKYILSSSLPYCIINISDNIARAANGFVLTDTKKLYYAGIDGNNEKIEAKYVIDNVETFTPNLTNEVFIKTSDNILYRVSEKNNNSIITFNLEKISDNVFDYKIRNTTDSSSHVFVLTNDKKMYHKGYIYNETSTGNGECVSGIGAGLEKSEYLALKQIAIDDNISKIYAFPSSMYLDNYIIAAIGDSGAVYRWGCGDSGRNIDKTKLSLPQKLTLAGEKIIEYNVSENDMWDNFAYILTDKNHFYDVTTDYKDTPLKINVPNNDKITKVHRFYIKFVTTESGNFYKLTWGKTESKLMLVNHFKNYSSAVVPYYYYGGSYIFKDSNNLLYVMGWNNAKSKEYYLGVGDIEFTANKYGENYAVKLGIDEPVKNVYTISKNLSNQSSIAVAESGNIYVWGANAGLLPVGNTDSIKEPLKLSISNANIKKFLWNEDASLDAQVFTILTNDGKVYSWGKNSLTGTDSKDNLSPDGYLLRPALVN
ncbi:MAG: PKD domain-containing protein [Candidatus Mucispirillum faecigallinarum]|nr:PKD domain-containing protein [Candidatus Mucispirillum faecigallinarum]